MTSSGCHQEIRDGRAALVTSADEVIDLVGDLGVDACEPLHGPVLPDDGLSLLDAAVLEAVPFRAGADLDRLVVATAQTPLGIRAALGRLERAGLVTEAEGRWRKRPVRSTAPADLAPPRAHFRPGAQLPGRVLRRRGARGALEGLGVSGSVHSTRLPGVSGPAHSTGVAVGVEVCDGAGVTDVAPDRVDVLERHADLLHAYSRHLGAERGRSPHTRRAYLGDVRNLLTFAAARGIVDLDELRIADLRAWLGEQADAGAARSTIARRAASARTFLGWAAHTGRIRSDPSLRLVAPKRHSSLPMCSSRAKRASCSMSPPCVPMTRPGPRARPCHARAALCQRNPCR